MKKNKKIEKIAEGSMKNLVNEEFFQELSEIQSYNQKENATRVNEERKPIFKRLSTYFALASTSIAIVVVLLCVFLIQPQSSLNIPQYAIDNITKEATSVDYINARLNGIQIAPDNITFTNILSDGPSGDKLFYNLIFEDVSDSYIRNADVSIVVNPYFEYLRLTTDKEIKYKNTTVFYSFELKEDPDKIVISKYYAYFEIGDYRIGINYEEYSFETPLGLTDFLDSFFLFK